MRIPASIDGVHTTGTGTVRCRTARRTRTPGVGPWNPKAERTHQSNAPPIQRSNVIYADPARLPLGSTSLARRRFSCSGMAEHVSVQLSQYRRRRGTAYPRTDQQRPNGAARQGRSLTNVESQAARSRQTLRGASGNHHWRPGTWAAWTFGPYQCGEVWFNSYRAKAL